MLCLGGFFYKGRWERYAAGEGAAVCSALVGQGLNDGSSLQQSLSGMSHF